MARKRKSEEAPPEPTRQQPARPVKRTEPYKPAEFGAALSAPKPTRCVAFVTTPAAHRRIGAIEELGRARRMMAEIATSCCSSAPLVIDNGALPAAMAHGPEGGAGAGWYNPWLQTFGVGKGTLDFIIAQEIAPERPRKVCRFRIASRSFSHLPNVPLSHVRPLTRSPSHTPQKTELSRDGEFYYTLFETHDNLVGWVDAVNQEFTRANSLALGMYYVNGPMIIGYNMDPDGLIPGHLIHAEIWWRCIGWYGFVDTGAYDEPAIPVRSPNLKNKRPLLTVPQHRQAVFVAGEFAVNQETLQVSGEPTLWADEMPLALDAHHEQFVKQLDPPAYNPYIRPPVRPITPCSALSSRAMPRAMPPCCHAAPLTHWRFPHSDAASTVRLQGQDGAEVKEGRALQHRVGH